MFRLRLYGWLLFADLACAEMHVSHAEVMPGPELPPCDNSEIKVAEECPNATSLGLDWSNFSQQLFAARAQLFGFSLSLAVSAVHRLLSQATSKFSDAFSCTAAVVSTYFTLARFLVLQGRLRRALAFLHLGFIFVRDRGFSECSTWPAAGWDVMLAGRSLTERVRLLDDESVLKLEPGHRVEGLRIAVVTICAYAADAPVRVLCEQNRQIYKALHGYDLHFFTDAAQILPNKAARMNVQDGIHKPFFWKVNAVKNILDTNKYDWVLWMDCDAFFMDPGRTIDSVIQMYSGNLTSASRLPPPSSGDSVEVRRVRRNMSQDAVVNISLIFAVDSTGINNGVWLLRNTAWSHDFLQRWWESDILEGPGREHNCSDQSTMLHALLQERAMNLDEMWDKYEAPIYPSEVRVARQEHLQSFHEATAATALSRAWRDGDFIKHHPGCHFYRLPCQQLYQEAQEIFYNKVVFLHQQ
ncbi:unnamed protein product [Symbiodinium sp. CCMP2456]|nr:unnamed protein product [Symbiodinium sp. CCMP2456]